MSALWGIIVKIGGTLVEGVDSGERLADHQRVHLGCSLVGQHRLEIVRVPHYWVFQRDAVRAEDGSAGTGDLQRLAYIVELADADLPRLQIARVLQPAQMHRQQKSLLQFQRHIGELLLGQLESGHRAIERLPIYRVRNGRLQAVPGRAQSAEYNAEARLVQTGQWAAQPAS